VRVQRTFPADPQSVPAARRFATEALRDSPDDARESVKLMVSELATNGIRHGQTSFRLVIERTPDQIRVEVTDSGAGTPQMRFPGPDEPTGRGLRIVDMLAERWGVERDSKMGKTVWFTVRVALGKSVVGDGGYGGAGRGLALR
jgi:anti-sigma regulatory factor (Ser/Thr protein kinase)